MSACSIIDLILFCTIRSLLCGPLPSVPFELRLLFVVSWHNVYEDRMTSAQLYGFVRDIRYLTKHASVTITR